jgi:hypothetical protein
VSATVNTDGPTRVGTRGVERRNVPGGTRDISYEITEHDPPRKASFRGTAGPIRPVGTYTVDPTGESSSRMNLKLDLEGHGIGKLFAILARRQAAKQVPVDHEKFKERLESGVAGGSFELTPRECRFPKAARSGVAEGIDQRRAQVAVPPGERKRSPGGERCRR